MADNIFTSSAFYKSLGEGKLMGTRCKSCGELHLPPRPICARCKSSDMEWREFSGKGQLAAYSVIFIAPTTMLNEGYSRTNPYCAGVAKLEEGPSISAQITGLDLAKPETITIGMPISAIYLRYGDEAAPKFRLAFEAEKK